jgi:hypothetical protein
MADYTVTVSGNDTVAVADNDGVISITNQSQPYATTISAGSGQQIDTVSVVGSIQEQIEAYVFTLSGKLRVYTGTGRLYLEGPYTVSNIRLSVGNLADRDIIVDLLKNGQSIYSDPPSIPAGEHTALANTGITAQTFVKGDFLTLDVLQCGLTLTGSDLAATIRLKRLY